jgi:hypothetical protein
MEVKLVGYHRWISNGVWDIAAIWGFLDDGPYWGGLYHFSDWVTTAFFFRSLDANRSLHQSADHLAYD